MSKKGKELLSRQEDVRSLSLVSARSCAKLVWPRAALGDGHLLGLSGQGVGITSERWVRRHAAGQPARAWRALAAGIIGVLAGPRNGPASFYNL